MVPQWREILADFKDFLEPVPEHTGLFAMGYFVPDPALFVGTKNRSTFFATWLQHADGFKYYFIGSHVQTRLFSAKDWRNILGAASSKTVIENSKRAKLRTELSELLRPCFGNDSGLSLKSEYTPGPTILWRGQTYPSADVPPPQVCREILWELSQINFRMEFLYLDRKLNPSSWSNSGVPETHGYELNERQLQHENIWPDFMLRPSVSNAASGLAAPDARLRCSYLAWMQLIMNDWPGAPGAGIDRPVPSPDSRCDFEAFEKKLIRFYIDSFLKTFFRAPQVPHYL